MNLLTFQRTDDSNCRIYFQDASKRLLCYQPSHVRGQFNLLVCSRDGEPSHPVNCGQYKIDRLPEASGGSTAVQFRTWYLAAASDNQRIFVTFHPEVWVNDHAIEADPGATEIDVTREVLGVGQLAAMKLTDNDYPSDELRMAVESPQWVKDWPGPHRVSCQDSIREYFQTGAEATAS